MKLVRSAIQKLFEIGGVSGQLEQQARLLERIQEQAGQLSQLEQRLAGLEKASHVLVEQLQSLGNNANYVDRGTQYLLAQQYRQQAALGKYSRFAEVEFRNHSQAGEDGIIWYILALIGVYNSKCVELCAGNGMQCNTANLIINHGWQGLLCEGNEGLARQSEHYYRTHPDTWIIPPVCLHRWVTAENVNDLLGTYGFRGEIDLLSLDIDGIDYWLWRAIDTISPRLVVVEINSVLGCEAALTVPYDPAFRIRPVYDGDTLVGHYCGASLPAFVKLAREKGYRLVGGNRCASNAFFLREDLGVDELPEVPAESVLSHPAVQWASLRGRPHLAQLTWEVV